MARSCQATTTCRRRDRGWSGQAAFRPAFSTLFRAAVERSDLVWLVVAAVLVSVVSVYYYLRIVVAMYFRERTEPASGYASPATAAVLIVLAAVVLLLGVLPGPVLALVQ